MRIGVLHYHLKPGGVTRVVCHAVESLHPHGIDAAIIAGHVPDNFMFHDQSSEMVALGYNERDDLDPARLVNELVQTASDMLGGTPELWHIHNHSLGKNRISHRIVGELAKRGFPLLLQLHDFAEDGRPANMRRLKRGADPDKLYPVASHVHYGVLNGRDRKILHRAGFPEDRVHTIPNPVEIDLREPKPIDLHADRYVLYPTRAIRRKNIGEILLWAAAAETGDRFGLTLAPDNPEARPIYREWVSTAQALSLPVDFELGDNHGFSDLLHAADWVMTTSVAEGFGLAFLEPGLLPRPVTGRDLPDITHDFKQEGIQFPSLYTSLPVPLHLLDVESLRNEVRETVQSLFSAYEQPCTTERQEHYEHVILGGPTVDFGLLSETHQKQIIKNVCEGACPLPLPPWDRSVDPERLALNKDMIERTYNKSAYGDRLHKLYSHLLECSPDEQLDWISPDTLIRSFLTPEQFTFLRV